MRETISGVPLGLSRDYDALPHAGPLRTVRCSACQNQYEDCERFTTDGCRVMAGRCWVCREEGRERWIANKQRTLKLPRAIARLR